MPDTKMVKKSLSSAKHEISAYDKMQMQLALEFGKNQLQNPQQISAFDDDIESLMKPQKDDKGEEKKPGDETEAKSDNEDK